MSLYTQKSNDKRLETSDTFLLRVFGLHSIYNQTQQNYQFYDPANDVEDTNGDLPLLELLQRNLQFRRDLGDVELGMLASDRNLLNLDSELGLLSALEPLLPLLAPYKPSKLVLSDYSVVPGAGAGTRGDGRIVGDESELDPISINENYTSGNKTNKASVGTSLRFNLPQKTSQQPDIQTEHRKSSHATIPQHRLLVARNRRLIPPKEKALYLWANIVNMDDFLADLYYYYRGKGLVSIVMGRAVDIFILVFILGFTSFLKWGIDYEKYFNHWKSKSIETLTLSDLIIPGFVIHNIPFSFKILLLGFSAYIGLRLLQLYFDYRYKLAELQNFYRNLLGIPNDLELMTIPWSIIVERLMLLKDYNSLTSTSPNVPPHYVNDLNSKVRLNAHDIANRIMRKENYLIALVNKDVLDLSIPVPSFLLSFFNNKSVLTRTLEWNIKLCINNFIFNENGQVNAKILKEASRNQLSKELSSRFKKAAIINLLLCPFIVIYFVLLYFFRYFNEYKSNPSSILALRQYTPWAEWKLREFNELSHFFIKRLHLSVGPANTYINQFPGSVFAINIMALLNFVSGAVMAVLVIMGLLFEDEEHSFWSFELIDGRSTLFFISLFGTVWAVTSNSNTSTVTKTAENSNTQGISFFYDPEASLRYVSQFTHYLPSSWNGRLHTVGVKNEFCELYSLKIVIIMNEILSLVLTPFILWFKISSSSSRIIDFFREYTIHVDGLGHVCYFAMFNFEQKDKNMMYKLNTKSKANQKTDKPKAAKAKQSDLEESSEEEDPDLNDYYQDDKMIKSYMYFLQSYGNEDQRKADGKALPKAPIGVAPPIQPTESMVISRRPGTNSKERGTPYGYGSEFHELSYNFAERLDASGETVDKRRKGVLGMLNQFSRPAERP
ncbi:hypothetical protein PUMCH_005153 [Australozyma saopauloensis]|uniref:Autophagy-related protein 9 n=1 Tax=Australozyma saopauloensis TaxID=291208 RepID=A0AAX4HGV9_9ASCO|nr:hypothetical protein PUMCH_005153 [[Candida] saopauloensis]